MLQESAQLFVQEMCKYLLLTFKNTRHDVKRRILKQKMKQKKTDLQFSFIAISSNSNSW